MKYWILRLFLCISVILTVRVPLCAQNSPRKLSPHQSCKALKQEVDVYADFLRGETAGASNSLSVLVSSTEARNYDADILKLQLAARGHGIPPEILADFTTKNKSSCEVEPFSGVPNLRFISKSEESAIFRDGWAGFHEKFGKESEVVAVSRVGFNADKTLALLHAIRGISRYGVAGGLYYLERKNGIWVVKFHTQTVAV